MHLYLLDVLFVLIVGGATFALSKRSFLEVVVVWFAFVVASLIALNSFEPTAHFIVTNMFAPTDEWLFCYVWLASLLSIFALAVTLTLMGFTKLLDGVQFDSVLPAGGKTEFVGRWGFSVLGAYVLAAFLLTSVHTFPANRDFGGYFPPELHRRHGPILAAGPDYQMLTFAELVSTPHAPLTGAPWKLEGPMVEASLSSNRWSSFPIRYALWREGVDIKLNDYDLPENDEYEDEPDDEGYDPKEQDAEQVVAYSF